MFSPIVYRKTTAFCLSVAYALSNVVFVHSAESRFWADRQRARRSDQSDPRGWLAQAGPAALPNAALPRVAAVEPGAAARSAREERLPERLSPDHRRWLAAVPAARASLRRVTLPPQAPRGLVIHLQDVHHHVEAQKNLGGTVDALLAAGGRRSPWVALEGAFGPVDLSVPRAFPDPAALAAAAEEMLLQNEISGPIQALLTRAGPAPLVLGIDDPAHYAANVEAYRRAHPRLAAEKERLSRARAALEDEKAKTGNTALLDFDRRARAYHGGATRLGAFARSLAPLPKGRHPALAHFLDTLAMEDAIDFARVEVERGRVLERLARSLSPEDTARLVAQGVAYRSGELSAADFYLSLDELCQKAGVALSGTPAFADYLRYVLHAHRIDAEALFEDLRVREEAVVEGLLSTPVERRLWAESGRLALEEKLADFSLTPEEWAGLAAKGPARSAVLAYAERFYVEAQSRDEAMAAGMLKKLADAPEALLVTGGYHARGLTERLTRAGYAVASVVPKLTNIEGPQGAAYLAVFAEEKTPLDRLFEGPKLFLAAPPASDESLARTELTAGAVAVGGEPDGALPGPVRDHLKRTFTVIDGGRKGGVSSVRVRHRGRTIVASFDPTKPGGRKARWGLVGRARPTREDFRRWTGRIGSRARNLLRGAWGAPPSVAVVSPAAVRRLDPRAVFIDFDLTLWAGYPFDPQANLFVDRLFNGDPAKRAPMARFLKRISGLGEADKLAALRNDRALGFPPMDAAAWTAVYREVRALIKARIESNFDPRLVPGAMELLQAVKASGRPVFVLTGGNAAECRARAERLGLAPFLDGYFGDGDKAARLAEALKKENLAPHQALMIGDAPSDMEAARSQGVLGVGLALEPADDVLLKEAGAGVLVRRAFNDPGALLGVLKLETPPTVFPARAGMRTAVGTYAPLFQIRSDRDWGIGDFGTAARTAELHRALGLTLLQIEPLNMPSAGNSPYSVASSRAIEPNRIDVEAAVARFAPQGETAAWVAAAEIQRRIAALRASPRVRYAEVDALKREALSRLWAEVKDTPAVRAALAEFRGANEAWLTDHLLYVVLKRRFLAEPPGAAAGPMWDWRNWPAGLRDRDRGALRRARIDNREALAFETFLQFLAADQRRRFVDQSRRLGVEVMLDIPFALDGADLWIHPEVFGLKKSDGYRRSVTQGVPPESAYPAGQYWQFYPFDWSNPASADFIDELLRFNQRWASCVRLDHVLGYYRSYLFSEDARGRLTLESLGLYRALRELQERGRAAGDDVKRAAVDEARRLLLEKFQRLDRGTPVEDNSLPAVLRGRLFGADGALTPDAALIVARSADGTPPGGSWNRQYVVEKAVFEDRPWWDFLRLTPRSDGGDGGFLWEYLFGSGGDVRPTDSLRPAAFVRAPGEEILSRLLATAQANGTQLVWETLGTVPPGVPESVRRLGGTDYLPVIYGENPGSLYHPTRHTANAYVTMGLHDSTTLRHRWENEWSEADRRHLWGLMRPDRAPPEDLRSFTPDVRDGLIALVMKSPARIAALTWTDLLGLGEEHRINAPGVQDGQWTGRWPFTVEEMGRVLATNDADHPAHGALTALPRLVAEGGRHRGAAPPTGLLRTDPETDGVMVQIRPFGQPFVIDAYVNRPGGVPRWRVQDPEGRTLADLPLKGGDSVGSLVGGTPPGVTRWRTEWRAPRPGDYTFTVEIDGATSAPGRLRAVPVGTDLNPLSPGYGQHKPSLLARLGRGVVSLLVVLSLGVGSSFPVDAREERIFAEQGWTVLGAEDSGPGARAIRTPAGAFTELKILKGKVQVGSIKGNGYFRLTPPDTVWGTSFVTPGYWADGRQHITLITDATYSTDEEGRLTVKGRLDSPHVSANDWTWTFRPSDPSGGVETGLAFTLKANREFALDPDRADSGEAMKIAQFSSMNIGSDWDADGVTAGDRSGSLARADARVFDWPVPLGRGQEVVLANDGLSRPRQTPTTFFRVDKSPGPLLVQGWVTRSNDPNDDNVGVWLAWDGRGQTRFRPGDVIGGPVELIAGARPPGDPPTLPPASGFSSIDEASFRRAQKSVESMGEFLRDYFAARGFAPRAEHVLRGIAEHYTAPRAPHRPYADLAAEFTPGRLDSMVKAGELRRLPPGGSWIPPDWEWKGRPIGRWYAVYVAGALEGAGVLALAAKGFPLLLAALAPGLGDSLVFDVLRTVTAGGGAWALFRYLHWPLNRDALSNASVVKLGAAMFLAGVLAGFPWWEPLAGNILFGALLAFVSIEHYRENFKIFSEVKPATGGAEESPVPRVRPRDPMEVLRGLTETAPPGWGSWQILRGKDSVVLHAYVEAFGREPVNQFEMKVRLGAVDDWGGTWNRVQEFSMTDPLKGAYWRNGEAFFSTRLQVPPGKYEYEFLLRKYPTGPWIKEKGKTRVHRLLADPGGARFALRQKFVPIRQGQGTTWQARRLSDRLGAGFVNAEPERGAKIILHALKDIVYYAVENTQQHGRPGAEAFVDAWVEGDALFVEVVNPSDLPLPAELDGEYSVTSPNPPVPKEKRGPGSRRGEAVARVRSLVNKVYSDAAVASVLAPRARWSWRREPATGAVVFRLSIPLPEVGKAALAPSAPFGAEEVEIAPLTPESARRFEADLLAMERGRPGGWRTLSRFLEEKRAATGTPLEGKWEFSFLAVVKGRAVGYLIGVRPNADKPYAREDLALRGLPVSKGLVVFRAGVLDSARGQGVGRRLWRAAAEAAEAAGIDYIYQDARVDNTRARDLYRRLGFVDIAGFNDSSKDIDYMAMVARTRDLRSSTGGRAPGIASQVLGLSGLVFMAEALERYLSWMGGLLWMAPPGATGPPAALIARAVESARSVDRAMSTGGYDRLTGLAGDLKAALLNLGKGPAGLRSLLENTLETAELAVAQLGPEVARRSLDAPRVSFLFVAAETALLANDAPAAAKALDALESIRPGLLFKEAQYHGTLRWALAVVRNEPDAAARFQSAVAHRFVDGLLGWTEESFHARFLGRDGGTAGGDAAPMSLTLAAAAPRVAPTDLRALIKEAVGAPASVSTARARRLGVPADEWSRWLDQLKSRGLLTGDGAGPSTARPRGGAGRLTLWVLAAGLGLLWMAFGPFPIGAAEWHQTVFSAAGVLPWLALGTNRPVPPDRRRPVEQAPLGRVAAVNLMDAGSRIEGDGFTTARGLAKVARLFPTLARRGFTQVYLYNGLYAMSALGDMIHRDGGASPRLVKSGPAQVRVEGYTPKRMERDGLVYRDHGNNFSIASMDRLNPAVVDGVTNEERWARFAEAVAAARRAGLGVVVDFNPWISPDALTPETARWAEEVRPVVGADRDRSDEELLAQPDNAEFALLTFGAERLLVKNCFPGKDQMKPNPRHPDYAAYLDRSLRRLIDAGVTGVRVDMAGDLTVSQVGVDWEFWGRLIEDARRYAESKGQKIHFIMEAFKDNWPERFLDRYPDNYVYHAAPFHIFRALAKGDRAALPELRRDLDDILSRRRGQYVVYPTNFDEPSLRAMGGPTAAFVAMLLTYERLGLPLLLDLRELMGEEGQNIPQAGGETRDEAGRFQHPFSNPARRDWREFRRRLEREDPLGVGPWVAELAAADRVEVLDTSDPTRYFAVRLTWENGEEVVRVFDFFPEDPTEEKDVPLPANPPNIPSFRTAMVNLMDVGSHLRAAKMATDRGLAKATRLLPFLAEIGMNDIYIHNGLYEPSAAGVVVHTESTAAPNLLRFGPATVFVQDYTPKRMTVTVDGRSIELGDDFGNNYAVDDMNRLNPAVVDGDTNEDRWSSLASFTAAARQKGLTVTVDLVPWLTPLNVTFDRLGWAKEVVKVEGERAALSERALLEANRDHVLLTFPEGRFLVRRYMGVDQIAPDFTHPQYFSYLESHLRRLIDAGVSRVRVDMAHDLIDPARDPQWGRWTKLINGAKAHAARRGLSFHFLMEAYGPWAVEFLRRFPEEQVYHVDPHHNYRRVAAGNDPRALPDLLAALNYARDVQKGLFVAFPTNFDMPSLANIGGPTEAFLKLLLVYERLGVPLMVDLRELLGEEGQNIPQAGGQEIVNGNFGHPFLRTPRRGYRGLLRLIGARPSPAAVIRDWRETLRNAASVEILESNDPARFVTLRITNKEGWQRVEDLDFNPQAGPPVNDRWIRWSAGMARAAALLAPAVGVLLIGALTPGAAWAVDAASGATGVLEIVGWTALAWVALSVVVVSLVARAVGRGKRGEWVESVQVSPLPWGKIVRTLLRGAAWVHDERSSLRFLRRAAEVIRTVGPEGLSAAERREVHFAVQDLRDLFSGKMVRGKALEEFHKTFVRPGAPATPAWLEPAAGRDGAILSAAVWGSPINFETAFRLEERNLAFKLNEFLPFEGPLDVQSVDGRSRGHEFLTRLAPALARSDYRRPFEAALRKTPPFERGPLPPWEVVLHRLRQMALGESTLSALPPGAPAQLEICNWNDRETVRDTVERVRAINRGADTPVRLILAGSDESTRERLNRWAGTDPWIAVLDRPVAPAGSLDLNALGESYARLIARPDWDRPLSLAVSASEGLIQNVGTAAAAVAALPAALGEALRRFMEAMPLRPVDFNSQIQVLQILAQNA